MSIDDESLRVTLRDGREIDVPVASIEWLAPASDDVRRDVEIVDSGAGLWWAALDEGLSVPGLLGLPENPPRVRLERYSVRYRLEGDRWIADLPEVESWTWGPTLAAARQHARATLAMLLDVKDVEADGIELEEEVATGTAAKA